MFYQKGKNDTIAHLPTQQVKDQFSNFLFAKKNKNTLIIQNSHSLSEIIQKLHLRTKRNQTLQLTKFHRDKLVLTFLKDRASPAAVVFIYQSTSVRGFRVLNHQQKNRSKNKMM